MTLNGKRNKINIVKKLVFGLLLVFVFIGVAFSTSTNDTDGDNEEKNIESVIKDDDKEDLEQDKTDFIDERPELEEQTVESLKEEAYVLASNGKWNELIILLDKYDKEFNLETSDEGMHLKDIYWDATVIARLEQMGDDENAVIAGIEKIPFLKTKEMYVWALYFLPRNNIVDLSVDSLALAPTARGAIEIKNIESTQFDENIREKLHEDEHIKYYINTTDEENEYNDGYFKIVVDNYGVEETVYGVIHIGGEYELIGIYSADAYYSNHIETVSHFRQFSEDVKAGVEKMLEDAENERLQNTEDREETE